jgi:hypothetical protein
MPNQKEKKIISDTMKEDVTQYGEFVPTFHKWITPKQQKEVVEYLENASKKTLYADSSDCFKKKGQENNSNKKKTNKKQK